MNPITFMPAHFAVSLVILFCNTASFAFYNPAAGRWLNRDPIGEGGGKNINAFVRNNPVDRVDLLGLEAFTASDKLAVWVIDKKIPVKEGCIKGNIVFEKVLVDASVGSSFYIELIQREATNHGGTIDDAKLQQLTSPSTVGGGVEIKWVPEKGCCECKNGYLQQWRLLDGTVREEDGHYSNFQEFDLPFVQIEPPTRAWRFGDRFEVALFCSGKSQKSVYWSWEGSFNPTRTPRTTVTVTIP